MLSNFKSRKFLLASSTAAALFSEGKYVQAAGVAVAYLVVEGILDLKALRSAVDVVDEVLDEAEDIRFS